MSSVVKPHDMAIVCGSDTFFGVARALHLVASWERGFNASRVLAEDHGLEQYEKIIEESKTIIFVFSELFPPSLHHLPTLKSHQLFIPFYYDVKIPIPSEIPDSNAVQFTWDGDTNEHECIDNILTKVSEHVASQIGLQPLIDKVIQLESEFTGRVNIVEISGAPGFGMKTLAPAIYDSSAREEYDIICCVEDVGENIRKYGGGYLLNIIRNCMDIENLKGLIGESHIVSGTGSLQEGMSLIKETLKQKKVLLTLDGVDCAVVMQDIVEVSHDFGPGSLVLVTAQEKGLFESLGIEKIYAVDRLDKTLSYQLLCLYAFSSKDMDCKYMDIIHRAEICAAGNPFDLQVIGSSFRGKTVVDCELALAQYERIPNADLILYMIREKNQIQLSEDILPDNMEYVMEDGQLPMVMEA